MPKRPLKEAAELAPGQPTLASVREAAKDCKACGLWKRPDTDDIRRMRAQIGSDARRRTALATRTISAGISSLLRAPGDETRQRETTRFIDDLQAVAKRLK